MYTIKRGKVFSILPGVVFTAIAEVCHMGLVLEAIIALGNARAGKGEKEAKEIG